MVETRRPLDSLRLIASQDGFAVYDNARRKLAVMAIDVLVRPGHAPQMQVVLPAGSVDVVGKALFAVIDVENGKPRIVKRIEWADGQHTDFPEPEKQAGSVVSTEVPANSGNGGTRNVVGSVDSVTYDDTPKEGVNGNRV